MELVQHQNPVGREGREASGEGLVAGAGDLLKYRATAVKSLLLGPASLSRDAVRSAPLAGVLKSLHQSD